MATDRHETLRNERLARSAAELRLKEKILELHLKNEELSRHVAELETTKQELESATRRLTHALEAAASGNQVKSQFLATMSHELRTPLNAIIGFSEILKEQIFGPIGSNRYQDYAASIYTSGSHLLELINDVLDISKFDAGKLELHEEVVNIGELVAECLRLMEPQARKAAVHLEASGKGEFLLRGDDRRLRQILLNLLSNAVKFTPGGGAVRTEIGCHGGEFRVAVIDTGIGIAPADIPRALERFGQIDSTLSRRHDGTGLGLPLAKHLTELHGGRLLLESAVGVGTTVTLVFPPARIESPRRVA